MEIRLIMKTARSASFELADGGLYETIHPYSLFLNGKRWKTSSKGVTDVYNLEPDTDYELTVLARDCDAQGSCRFRTEREYVTLNVRDFGAAGDGVTDDTAFLQAAILACPADSRVLIPAGKYKFTSLFLKSGLNLELAAGAVLLADTCRARRVRLPGAVQSADGREDYQLGTWEGEPRRMYAGLITGIGVTDVTLYGEGTVDGCASPETWWRDPKNIGEGARPRLLFLNGCARVRVQGLCFRNSPSWTIHPYFCRELLFCGTEVLNPKDSPNTDGCDPESCRGVEILGMRFSLGDDCIAIKSGKLEMGRRYRTPSEDIRVRRCLMEDGHGAVTLGSEIGAGVKNVLVEQCRFARTDRGLRIKTRRGRGETSVVDGITFRDIEMDGVLVPFTANAFYFCDADGKTDYVQSRKALPVDERTPVLGSFLFENIRAKNCHAAAAYFLGLPERKIQRITMRNCRIAFAKEPEAFVPVMACGVEPLRRRGIYAAYVEELELEDVTVAGQEGEALTAQDVDRVMRK